MTKRSNHRDRINGLDQARDRSAAKAAHTTVADEIAILEKLLAEKRAANQNASQLSESVFKKWTGGVGGLTLAHARTNALPE
jgi:hypothetical protein